MGKQENHLDILINSCEKKAAPYSTGMGKVGLNFYRNKNDNVLIIIGSLNKESEYKYLNDYDVISKEELFLRFNTGCVGPSTIDVMLKSFNEYHDESVSSDISTFLQSLEASKIIICYTESMGGSDAALVILYKICQQINIDCIPIIIKPALFKGRILQRNFKDLLVYIDTYTYRIYDEDLCDYSNGFDLFKTYEVELLKIVNSEMKLLKHIPDATIDYGVIKKSLT